MTGQLTISPRHVVADIRTPTHGRDPVACPAPLNVSRGLWWTAGPTEDGVTWKRTRVLRCRSAPPGLEAGRLAGMRAVMSFVVASANRRSLRARPCFLAFRLPCPNSFGPVRSSTRWTRPSCRAALDPSTGKAAISPQEHPVIGGSGIRARVDAGACGGGEPRVQFRLSSGRRCSGPSGSPPRVAMSRAASSPAARAGSFASGHHGRSGKHFAAWARHPGSRSSSALLLCRRSSGDAVDDVLAVGGNVDGPVAADGENARARIGLAQVAHLGAAECLLFPAPTIMHRAEGRASNDAAPWTGPRPRAALPPGRGCHNAVMASLQDLAQHEQREEPPTPRPQQAQREPSARPTSSCSAPSRPPGASDPNQHKKDRSRLQQGVRSSQSMHLLWCQPVGKTASAPSHRSSGSPITGPH